MRYISPVLGQLQFFLERQVNVGEDVEKLEPCILLVAMKNYTVAIANSLLVLQKDKHRSTI